ncbi:MAG: TIGR03620 family F420-dependent LLM class oxidoreductase [Pseudonocardiaceae bacterium]|nr:TIGR03620 family F420-dependent LLM class oxidoreductase [Pseudonocardiaceae bacterium]
MAAVRNAIRPSSVSPSEDPVRQGGTVTVELGRIGVWGRTPDWEGADGTETVAELDELGYGALWLGMSPADLRPHERLLAASKRLVVASGIVNVWTEPSDVVIPAYHRVIAGYPGRFLLGVGSGHKLLVEAMTEYQYERPYSALSSYVDRLLGAENPVTRENLALAALGPRTLRLAGERSAGAHPYLTTPEHTRQAREILGGGPLLAPEQKVVLEADPARAREIARSGLEFYLRLPNYVNNWRRLGFTEDDFADGGSDRLVDALVVWGSLDAVRRRITEHHDAGADHVCLQVLTADSGLPRREYRILAEALA